MIKRTVPKLKDNKKFVERMHITRKYVLSDSLGIKQFNKEVAEQIKGA